jgi:general secretion pathway protein G
MTVLSRVVAALRRRARRTAKAELGMTLVEIMVVVAIIGLLMVVTIPSFRKASREAQTTIARQDLRIIAAAVDQLGFDTGRWPGGQLLDAGSDETVWNLNSEDAGIVSGDGRFPRWRGPYMKAVPHDPWGQDYFFDPAYTYQGSNRVVVGSFGPNRQGRNLHDSDDIIVLLR